MNVGVTFHSAVKERYGRVEDETGGIIEEDMYVVGANQQTTYVEVVGAQSVNIQQR